MSPAARSTGAVVIGHRGNPAAHQENSTAGFRSLVGSGVRAAECDVRLTADMALVCSHDPTTERLGGVPTPIAEQTLDQLRATVLRHGLPLSTLDEVLDACRGLGVVVEIKNRVGQPDFRTDRRQGAILVDLLRERRDRGCVDDILAVSSFDPQMLAAVARGEPGLADRCTLLARPLVAHDALRTAVRAGLQHLHMHVSDLLLRPRLVRDANSDGMDVGVWTVNDPRIARRVVELGVAAVITDRPERLLGIVAGTRARPWPASG